jgi:hypothetical protein
LKEGNGEFISQEARIYNLTIITEMLSVLPALRDARRSSVAALELFSCARMISTAASSSMTSHTFVGVSSSKTSDRGLPYSVTGKDKMSVIVLERSYAHEGLSRHIILHGTVSQCPCNGQNAW